MISNYGLLFIEPQGTPSKEPLIDDLTRKMTAAIRRASQAKRGGIMGADGSFTDGLSTKGFHVCGCRQAHSASHDYLLFNGMATNSLCVHYLAYHRDEVPQEDLVLVEQLDDGLLDPTENELTGAVWVRERATR